MVNRRNDIAGVTLGMVTPSQVSPTRCLRSPYAAGRWLRFQFLTAATRSLGFAQTLKGSLCWLMVSQR